MRYVVAAIFGFCLMSAQADACLRADIDGRPPKQVVENSQALAKANVHSPVVGLLSVTFDAGTAHGTGVALDPTTILTVAHLAAKAKEEGKMIYFDPKNVAGVEKTSYKGSAIYVHPDFEFQKQEPAFMTLDKDGDWTLYGVKLKTSKDLTFEQFRQQFPEKTRGYKGPDLAIVKLDKALSVKLFPEILSKDTKIEASYGYTLGFSHIRTCHPQKPIQLMEYGQKGYRKHHITSKVSSYNDGSANVLYGNYCGRLVDGAEAFLPNDKMMKTEGVPYQGDSGAPFFVKVDGKDYLTGIFASINCCNSQVFPEKEQRHTIEGFIQPIFPTWIDIRHYQDWIREHMGKKK